ncbi:hypothetical protein ACFFU9_05615 [Mariniflexile ostreae]|uniref:Uncharacterized protein n=1 Tax=Mariniflexile ostreae TaxID=1520892 RepID=A0ABV5F9U2_9FLAO
MNSKNKIFLWLTKILNVVRRRLAKSKIVILELCCAYRAYEAFFFTIVMSEKSNILVLNDFIGLIGARKSYFANSAQDGHDHHQRFV